ncbi:MAG: CTQ-dependent lysine 6-oxidase LodA [Planctomycetota bacterium]
MATKFEIHPRIGVARLGNSTTDFYLAPESVGSLPIDCDSSGNSKNQPVSGFKDNVGAIKRQGALFSIYVVEGNDTKRIDFGDVQSIEWTVHVANKKAVWYTFSELQGNLNFGNDNSYENQRIPVNNSQITGPAERQKLIIDPGPRTLTADATTSAEDRKVAFSRYNIPEDYPHGSFPPLDAGGKQIDELGEMIVNDSGQLVVLGGLGKVTGDGDITSFRGASGYWDDIADGYVTARITLKDGREFDAEPSWVLMGSPKYCPEIVNITTLADTMLDTAIRLGNARPDIYNEDFAGHEWEGFDFEAPDGYSAYCPLGGFNPDYVVDFEADIAPLFERMRGYRWVANIPTMAEFASPGFNIADARDENRENRIRYFQQFRIPLLPQDYESHYPIVNGPSELFPTGQQGQDQRIPLMPMNSGDNSVTNHGPIYKFETLSPTQYFCLYQWAIGKFTTRSGEARPVYDTPGVQPMDLIDIGNCVGAPFSPGIEVTWSVRSGNIYQGPCWLKTAHGNTTEDLKSYYRANGLSISANETIPDSPGVEPGDLTKRMAIPWMADFHECTVQTPNISNPFVNQLEDGSGIQVPPAFYVYWWPPQSPFNVTTGTSIPQDQVLDAYVSDIDMQPVIPEGQDVLYQRGIYTASDMISHWADLGFVVNRGNETIQYQVETERNFSQFAQSYINLRSGNQTTNIVSGATK